MASGNVMFSANNNLRRQLMAYGIMAASGMAASGINNGVMAISISWRNGGENRS